MIQNERQYRITRAQAEKFAHALEQFRKESENPRTHPILRKAQEDALRSQLEDLQKQIQDYEALRSGQRQARALRSLEELPRALIEARIAAGMSQKELARALGIKEQQVQRYEATEYASASLTRVIKVARALGVAVGERQH